MLDVKGKCSKCGEIWPHWCIGKVCGDSKRACSGWIERYEPTKEEQWLDSLVEVRHTIIRLRESMPRPKVHCETANILRDVERRLIEARVELQRAGRESRNRV